MIPHTRNPAPVPIPSTESIRQTNGFCAPQINNPIKATVTMAMTGETLRNANNMGRYTLASQVMASLFLNAEYLSPVSCRRTAMPNAFFDPTSTTSFFPLVTAV
jgi:hypothetical protein